jgi:hypothetical protein
VWKRALALAAIAAVSWLARPRARPAPVELQAEARAFVWYVEYPRGFVDFGRIDAPDDRRARVTVKSDRTQLCVVPELAVVLLLSPRRPVTFEPKRDASVYCNGVLVAGIRRVPDVDRSWTACSLDVPPKNVGERLVVQNGCTICHSLDGSARAAPSFKGIFGRSEELVGGARVVVDEEYLRESIRHPQAKIVRGYERVVMPTFSLSDRQIDAIVLYLGALE